MSAQKQLLIVDDSTSMRQMVAFALSSGGYNVKEAEDGQAALDIARTAKFDAVVTDVNMPRMDGIEMIRQLRQLPEYKFVPLLMLTTESGPEKKQEGRAAGATGWLVKPFEPAQLVATVGRLRGTYTMTPRMYVSGIVQYNSTSTSLGSNLLDMTPATIKGPRGGRPLRPRRKTGDALLRRRRARTVWAAHRLLAAGWRRRRARHRRR